jgi:HAE1 family hydrophobic/amphiphilic exporter-1
LSVPDGESRSVFQLTTTRPVAVTMVFVTLFTFGWMSLNRLPLNLLPDISYPRATVRAEYPGAAPEDVEERVTKRLHEALSVLGDLESISSVSRAELVDVTLEFAWGTNLVDSVLDIRERLDRANLPLEVGTPLILRYDPTLDPIMVLALTGGRDLVELRRLAEDRLAPAMSTIQGVAAVRVRGGLEDEIQVRLKPDRLATYGLRPDDVAARLSAENVNLASGTVLEGDTEYLVRILNEYVSPDEIANTILFRMEDSIVRLSDLADVRRAHKEQDVITRMDGRLSVELQVFKEADSNIVELAERVRHRLLGTPLQRAWVDGLRNGTREDPDEAMESFLAGVESDPDKSASMERIEKAQRAMMAMGWGGGGQGGGGGGGFGGGEGGWTDERTETEKALDLELGTELARLRKELTDKDDAFDYLAADLPADVVVHPLTDQSRFIKSAIEEVRDAAGMGAVFAVLVLFLFLAKLGTTLIIAVAIPVSVIVTFAALDWSETSLNVMSLGGLALGIGMVVDNAIVVLESIARCRERGMGRAAAAVAGVREVAGAATASTLTTIAVFAPIIFVEGIAGQVFRDQALTVVASLAVSLVVALFLVPMLASRGGDDDKAGRVDLMAPLRTGFRVLKSPLLAWTGMRDAFVRRGTLGRVLMALPLLFVFVLQLTFELLGRAIVLTVTLVAASVNAAVAAALGLVLVVMWLPAKIFRLVYGALEAAYAPFVGRVVRSPAAVGVVLLTAALLMVWTWQTVSTLGSEMLPEVHQGELIGRIAMPVGTPLETTDLVAGIAEEALADDPRVAWVSTTIGVPRDEVNQPDEGEHTARLVIGLAPTQQMEAAEEGVMADLREILANVPELRDQRFERPSLFTVNAPITVEIRGDDLGVLATVADEVADMLRSQPGLRDVRSSVQPGSPEIMLSFDRDLLNRYDLDTRRVAETVRDMVEGKVATRFTDEELKLDVLVQVDKQELRSLDDLLALPVNPREEASEPLASLANSRVREGPREIRRIWGQRAAVVSASLSGFDIGSASQRIREAVQPIEHQHPVVVGLGGQGQEMDGALSQMLTALGLAVFLVYVVMASIFESLIQPLIILVTVPLALVGAVAALSLLDMPLSVVVFIGAIILAGIVVNNAIVLIDAINRRRRLDGMELLDAVRVACSLRLRPILMTTMTTVLGLLPLTGLLPGSGGEGAELRAPMAVTVVAGLTAATGLTLLVIPCMYVIVEGLLLKLKPAGDATDAEAA